MSWTDKLWVEQVPLNLLKEDIMMSCANLIVLQENCFLIAIKEDYTTLQTDRQTEVCLCEEGIEIVCTFAL